MTTPNRHASVSKKQGNPTARTRPHRTASPADRFPKLMLRSFLLTAAIGAGLILLLSMAAYFLPDPDPMIHPMGLAAAALTALLGGVVAGKLHGKAPAACGLANGALLMVLMLLLSLLLQGNRQDYEAWVTVLLYIGVLGVSCLGAILGVQPPRKQSSRRRR